MDPHSTRIDRALETVYWISRRTHGGTRKVESWVGPHQLVVVVPPGGWHFHEPYCPRAGLMEHVQYMPLTRALRQRLHRCPLCWPLHRVGEGQPLRPQGGGAAAVSPLSSLQGETLPTHLSVCLPRLPSLRVRLHAPSPSDYAAEWQVLTTFLLAAMPHFTQAGLDVVPRAGLLMVGQERLSWPELLQAARRLMPREAVGVMAQISTGTVAECARQREYAPRLEGLSLQAQPTGWLMRRSSGDVEAHPSTPELAQRAAGAWGARKGPSLTLFGTLGVRCSYVGSADSTSNVEQSLQRQKDRLCGP
jgi:hypothetical protein